jgi:hypothetical protein
MVIKGSIAIAIFAVIVLSSFALAGVPVDPSVISDKIVLSDSPKTDELYASGSEFENTLASGPIFKLYDFVCEEDIEAYQCRLGPHPTDFPDYFDAQICNRQFLEITHNDDLDWPDEDVVGGDAWTNYATHHFFVLKDVDSDRLRRFTVGYVTYNKYYNGEEHHYLYVKNFETNEWERLDDTFAPRLEQGFMGYISNFGDQTDYVNEENEMWFMGTEGQHSGKAIGSDAFAVLLRFRIFGVESLDQNLAPDWMAYVFE